MQNKFFGISCLKSLIVCLAPLVAGFSACSPEHSDDLSISEIEDNFKNPHGCTDIAVYWYWLNDNISADGVVKDLDAMRRVGITRAYIGFQGIDDIPQGKVPFESDEWWKILETALRHAGEAGIDIGIFNSPGWSQSGGPWVKPEQAMKYIESAEITVEGNGSEQIISLPEIDGAVDDVAVIAYPEVDAEFYAATKNFRKSPDKVFVGSISFEKPVIARTLEIKVSTPFRTTGTLEAMVEGNWQLIKKFPIERYNAELHVGFKPYAPVVVALPATEAKDFRITVAAGEGDMEVTLTEQPRLGQYAEKSMAKMFQEPLPLWGDYMWEKQPEAGADNLTVSSEDVKDLTDKLASDGKLHWNVPSGKWVISVLKSKLTGVCNTPAMPDARGLEIDKLSRRRAEEHFDAFIGEILRRIPPENRKSFKYVVSDSYEVGGQNWTEGLLESFQQRYGYSPLPFLPTLRGEVVDSRDVSDRFLWDLRRFVADRLADEYIAGLKDKANKNGLKLWLENYGHWGYTGEFLQYGGRADEVSGEFWSEGNLGDIENRGAASCAHIYGKDIVWSESCTSGVPAFCRYPAMMKQRVDQFFTEGINSTLLHLYIQQQDDRQPGLAAWFGNEFNRNNVWFDQLDIFLTYLKRCNYMLRQGKYVADVAYFIGEDAPKMTGVCDPELPYGYSFDFINGEILQNKAKVADGKLVLESGMEYSVLVLPNQTTMRPEMLAKIKEFVNDGLTVVGPRPTSSPSYQDYPQADKQLSADADLLWKSDSEPTKYGKGVVYPYGASLLRVLGKLGVSPDFSVDGKQAKPLFIHRTLGDSEVYFLSNQTDEVRFCKATFRVAGKDFVPQLWNPLTGEITFLPEFERNSNGTITVPLELQPTGSAFVVFRELGNNKPDVVRNISVITEIDTISGPWHLTFEADRRGPAGEIVMERLMPLNQSDNDSIKYYSGKTVYKSEFTLGDPVPEDLYIDLGDVMVMGRVKINGEYAGGVWTAPRRLGITHLVRPGKNSVEVETVNNWKNRMIYDDSLAPEQRLTWSNQNNFHFGDELQPSGLIGPVRLITLSQK